MADGSGWIDIHGHYYAPLTQEQAEQQFKARNDACFLTPGPATLVYDQEGVLAYLDRAGISMQMLSVVPKTLEALKASNDYGASLVKKHPSRFGLLAALPTNDPQATLAEIKRAKSELHADGFAVTCHYNNAYLGDPSLEPVMEELDRQGAVVFMHPDAYKPPVQGRPVPIIEVAFETTRTLVDMLYAGTFRKYPNINFIASHGGGALPLLADRLELLGTEPWVPNPNNITKEEVKEQLSRLYVDTAAVGVAAMLPALRLVGKKRVVYGADCGVPCSTEATMEENRLNILSYEGLTEEEKDAIGHNVKGLFPEAVKRTKGMANGHAH
jgi:predicted TIM-barrel fold metal-dependent hydrolase